MRRRLLGIVNNDTNALGILGANFSAGFVAGSIAAATTCPLDVARTRRQIEVRVFDLRKTCLFAYIITQYLRFTFSIVFQKDPCRAMRMTTRQTLIEVWRYVLKDSIFYLLIKKKKALCLH